MNSLRKNKILIIILFLALIIAGIWILYSMFGHRLVREMYEGKSLQILNKIIQSRALRPLEAYYKEADWLFLNISIFFCLGAFLLLYACFGKNKNLIFYGIISAYALYCVIFIAKTSFTINGIRYFTLFDDAMIGMRYAKNLAAGYGLVWNSGEMPIEGYTNLLWVLYMAFWHLLAIPSAKISLFIQASGAAFLIGSLFLVKRISDDIPGANKYVSIIAVLITASYIPISFWALKGMETSALCFIILLAIRRFFKCLNAKGFDPFLFVILGVGILIRIDFAFLFIAMSAYIIVVLPEHRKKNMVTAVFIFLVIASGETLFRWLYYGKLFPNTYYLKVTGVLPFLRIQKGLWVAKVFIKNMSPFLFILPFGYCVLKRNNKKALFLLYVFIMQLIYSIYAGGDAWEWWGHFANRYLCVVMPLFFILLSLSVIYLMQKIRIFRVDYSGAGVILKKLFLSAIALLVIFQLHGGVINAVVGLSGIHVDRDRDMVRLALELKKITTPNAKIAVVWAGAIPYFSERPSMDLLGKTSVFIASQKAKIKNYREFWPGHNKHDYNYSIIKIKPDIIAQIFKYDEEEKELFLYLNKYYKTIDIIGPKIAYTHDNKIFCRKNSANINYSKIINGIIPADS